MNSEAQCFNEMSYDEVKIFRDCVEQAVASSPHTFVSQMDTLRDAFTRGFRSEWKWRQRWSEKLEGEEFKTDVLPRFEARIAELRETSSRETSELTPVHPGSTALTSVPHLDASTTGQKATLSEMTEDR